MKYTYATMKSSAVTLRNAGKTLFEIETSLGITNGIAKLLTKDAAFTKTLASSALTREKAVKKHRP